LTVLVMSGVFLSATIIAGLLMVYQIAQVTKVIDSAQAVFAADAAIERGLFSVFRCNSPNTGDHVQPSGWDITIFCQHTADQNPAANLPQFFNDADYQLTISTNPSGQSHDPNATPGTVSVIRATGRAGRSARAFEVSF